MNTTNVIAQLQTPENQANLILQIIYALLSFICAVIVLIVKRQMSNVQKTTKENTTALQSQQMEIQNRIEVMSNMVDTLSQQRSLPVSTRTEVMLTARKANEPITPRSEPYTEELVNLDHLVTNNLISHVVLKDGAAYYV